MSDPFTAYLVAKTAKKWVPYAIGGGLGLLLAGLLIGVPSYFMVTGARATAKAMTAERDTYKASAENQAAGVKARDLTISRLNAQAILILNDWRDTRADAAETEAKTKDMAARVEAINRDMTEKANAQDADPVGLALDGLGRLCREQQARTGAAAGGC
jgi:hypothetical protein